MESDTMGRVLTEATIENLKDLWAAEQGLREARRLRAEAAQQLAPLIFRRGNTNLTVWPART